ncbi:hypothetical protein Acr_02g0008880 [Actinidia rufa]|uniref:Uncharacterized protein n=1 Tax=Actinidia rufa TaxID=165716 RepID=A0A7J0E869_9ERIC|nr:hypothetical protein Acr_02g0008880 [Actinidia rufa]
MDLQEPTEVGEDDNVIETLKFGDSLQLVKSVVSKEISIDRGEKNAKYAVPKEVLCDIDAIENIEKRDDVVERKDQLGVFRAPRNVVQEAHNLARFLLSFFVRHSWRHLGEPSQGSFAGEFGDLRELDRSQSWEQPIRWKNSGGVWVEVGRSLAELVLGSNFLVGNLPPQFTARAASAVRGSVAQNCLSCRRNVANNSIPLSVRSLGALTSTIALPSAHSLTPSPLCTQQHAVCSQPQSREDELMAELIRASILDHGKQPSDIFSSFPSLSSALSSLRLYQRLLSLTNSTCLCI